MVVIDHRQGCTIHTCISLSSFYALLSPLVADALVVLLIFFLPLRASEIIPMGLEDESQKVAATTEVKAKDIPDSVNHTDKLEEEFQKAVAEAKDIPDSIDHMDKLALYGLFKTATVGKCNIEDPGMLNITANAKYRAWKLFEGKTKDEAKAEYITKIAQIKEDL